MEEALDLSSDRLLNNNKGNKMTLFLALTTLEIRHFASIMSVVQCKGREEKLFEPEEYKIAVPKSN